MDQRSRLRLSRAVAHRMLLVFFICLAATAIAKAQVKVNIHAIQTNLPNSPYLNQNVTTEGIVNAVLSDGFYIVNSYNQATCPGGAILNCWDNEVSTSEGIYVYTKNAPDPSYATLGNLVWVTGLVTVSNSSADQAAQGTEIQISSPPIRADDVTYNLPAPVAADILASAQTGAFGQWLQFEGMRITIPNLLTTSGTGGTVATNSQPATSNGQFWGVLPDSSGNAVRPFRSAGISVLEPVPAGAPATVSRWSGNPSLLFIDSSSRGGPEAPLDVTANAAVSNLTGVVDYHENALGYTGLILDNGQFGYDGYGDGAVTPAPGANGAPAALPTSPIQVTIATQDLDNFYDTSTVGPQAFTTRVNKAALAIVQFENSPDIIGVQEVESLAALDALAAQISSDGGPTYTPCWFNGNDPSGLTNGFLINETKVDLISCNQVDASTPYNSTTLFGRPPLVLVVGLARGGQQDYELTIVNSELLNRTNISDPTLGKAVRAQRAAQAEELSTIIQGYQSAGAHVVSLGGYNSFEFSDGFVDTMGAIVGNPVAANLVTLAVSTDTDPTLINLTTQPANATDNRYTYVENGSAEETDHVVVSSDLAPITTISYARFGADFPVVDSNDPTTALHASSHDGVVSYVAITYAPQFALTSSLNPSEYSQNVTFTATATGPIGAATGTVTFYDGATTLCNAQGMVGGSATCAVSTLTVGQHAIKAVYSGDTIYGSATATLTQTVNPLPATLSLTGAPNPSYFGEKVVFTATASSSDGAPTGTVTFKDLTTGNGLGSGSLSGGLASVTVSNLAVGSHLIQASYGGDQTHSTATSNQVTQVVLVYAQGATLTCAPNPASFGTNVTCTDTITSLGGISTGTVTFNNGSNTLGTANLNNGVATFSTTALPVGIDPIVAVFPGSSQSTGVTSNVVNEEILPTFSLTLSPSSASVYTGQAATYTVGVVEEAGEGFSLNVALTCGGVPADTTCSFKPATVAGGGLGQLIVQTSAPTNTGASSQASARAAPPVILSGVLLLFWPKRLKGRRWWMTFVVLLAISAIGALNGCGGSGTLVGGTPVGSYTLTVSGSALNSPAPVIKTVTATLKVNSLF
jgi:hypothetical protein